MPCILITGGGGFVGQQLARSLLKDGRHTVILTDIVDPPVPPGIDTTNNLIVVKANLCTDSTTVIEHACLPDGSPPDAVVILHGIMSGKAEEDFDLGMAVNVDGTRALLDVLRAKALVYNSKLPRVIFASSLAVYGPPYTCAVSEGTKLSPQSSYGAEKAICETLICEYSRRKFIDGLVLRFPTVSVRPGVPAPAASAFLSGIIREPLNGVEVEVPIDDDGFESWICSPSILIANLCHALSLSPDVLSNETVVNLPGIVVSITDMLRALEKHGGKDVLDLVQRKSDSAAERILRSWPVHFDTAIAERLGFQRDESFDQITEQYVKYLAQN